MHNLIKLNTER